MKKFYTVLLAMVAFVSFPALAQYTMANYTITPASGEYVAEIEKVTVHWTGLADGIEAHIMSANVGNYVTITSGDETYKAIEMYAGSGIAPSVDDLVLVFPKITAPGTYVLNIQEGIVCDYDMMLSHEENEEYYVNSPITATYIIEDDTPRTAMSDYTIDPADGSTVTSIKKVTITFPQTAERDGIDEYGNIMRDITLACGDKVYHPYGANYPERDGYSSVEILFDEITEAGTYTLTVPAEMFKEFNVIVEDPAKETNPEIVAVYTISGNTGISGVEAADSDKVTVVDLMGRTVLKNASRTSLDSLGSGFYIVNGKKTAIRK